MGISGLISPVPLLAGPQLAQIDLPVMLGVAILCMPLFFVGAILNRFEGALFLVLYFVYVWYMMAVALSHSYVALLQASILYGLVPAMILYVLVSLLSDIYRRKQQSTERF